MKDLLNKWVNAIRRIAKASKDKEAFKQKMLIGHKGYYSVTKYFAYEGVIYVRRGVDSYPVDNLIGVYGEKEG